MGYITTVVLHNDALHMFKEHPEEFGNAILHGINTSFDIRKQVDVSFHGYANYISIEPPRHADDHTVYVHCGNTVFNLNPWNEDFKELARNNPNTAEKFIKIAQGILSDAKNELKKCLHKKK